MSASEFILEAETAYSVTTPKTTAAFNVLQGDALVAYGVAADSATTLAISNNGTALVWTPKEAVLAASFCPVYIWTHVVSASRAGLTVTLTSVGGNTYGGDLLLFRDSGGIGASSQATSASGAPTLNLTTTTANSVIVVVNGDWASVDGAARVYRTNAGALTETSYVFATGSFTVYGGYHADAGPIGTYAVGLTGPAAQKYAMAAVEVLGLTPGITLLSRPMRTRW
jgi:hypothetical protein